MLHDRYGLSYNRKSLQVEYHIQIQKGHIVFCCTSSFDVSHTICLFDKAVVMQ